jgi:hypothetical protein
VWSGLNLATFRNRWQWEGNATFGGSGGAANNNAEIWWYYAPGALTSAFVGALLNANFNDCATVNVVRVQNGAAISQWLTQRMEARASRPTAMAANFAKLPELLRNGLPATAGNHRSSALFLSSSANTQTIRPMPKRTSGMSGFNMKDRRVAIPIRRTARPQPIQ